MKVYLSKSNRSDPHVVDAVRTDLNRAGLEVVEFHGGTYSHDPMCDCDILVIVPQADYLMVGDPILRNPGSIHDRKGYGCQIGKGQSDQVVEFIEETKILHPDIIPTSRILVAEGVCRKEGSFTVEYGWFDSHVPIEGGDWKVSYAYLRVIPIYWSIEQHIEDMDLVIQPKKASASVVTKGTLRPGVTQHPDGRYYEERRYMDKHGYYRTDYRLVENPYVYENSNAQEVSKKAAVSSDDDEFPYKHATTERTKKLTSIEQDHIPMLACATLLNITLK